MCLYIYKCVFVNIYIYTYNLYIYKCDFVNIYIYI